MAAAVGRDIGRGGATPVSASCWLRLFSAAWWALVCRSARFSVGYGLTGCGGRRPGTLGAGSGEEYSGRSRRWHCPWTASVAPPPLFSSVEQPPSASAESCEQGQRPDGCSPPTTRKRVVLLPHAQIEPPQHPIHSRRTGSPTGMNRDDFPRQYPTLSLIDNAPETWDRRPSCSAHPLLHLIPYPKPRCQGPAVLQCHIGSGAVPGAGHRVGFGVGDLHDPQAAAGHFSRTVI